VLTLTGPTQAVAGEPIAFSASIQNLGPSAAQDVELTFSLDPGLRYAGITPDAGAICVAPAPGGSGDIVCAWPGATAPGATRTLQVLASGAAPGTGGVTVSGISSTADPAPANNSGGIGVTIGVSAALAPIVVPLANGVGLLLLALALGLCGMVAMPRRT
jgi:uncharacterized repeat protein (TIGR01451 family)